MIMDPLLCIVREPNSENCLDLILVVSPCEKVIIIPDTNYVTSAIRKFILDKFTGHAKSWKLPK